MKLLANNWPANCEKEFYRKGKSHYISEEN